jgi:hypothetical protein
MNSTQVSAVFAKIKERTTKEAPYQIVLVLMHGERFGGLATPVDANGMVRMEVDRVFDAHLSKPPAIVWFDINHIQAITDEEVLITPPVVVV